MIIRRLVALQAVLLLGLGSVFLLPKHITIQPAAIQIVLPEQVSEWSGTDVSITQGERESLGPDTQFSRKVYARGSDQIFVSIVLSGPDMNTSIHRPERCLPSQGWTIVDSKVVSLRLAEGGFAATRLHNVQNVKTNDGHVATIQGLNYYWFVGSSDATPSHLQRTWIDIRDRIWKGQNQQWAYVTVASTITRDFRIFGRDEGATDELLQAFVRDLVPQLQKRPLHVVWSR